MKNLTLLLLLLVSFASLNAVFDDYEPSPRARAMGGAYYSFSDTPAGIFYNPAGLYLAKTGLEASYSKLYSYDFAELTAVSAVVKLPKWYGSLAFGRQGLDVTYEDVDLMGEQMFSLAHSFKLIDDAHSQIYMGYGLNYYMLDMDGLGSDTAFGITAGALAILHQRTRIALTAVNLNNPTMGKDDEESLPQKLALGIAYDPYPTITTSLEVQKSFGDYTDTELNNTEIHGGVELQVIEHFKLRFGLRNNPTQYSAGACIEVMGAVIDYAWQNHSVLDSTHHFGIGYNF